MASKKARFEFDSRHLDSKLVRREVWETSLAPAEVRSAVWHSARLIEVFREDRNEIANVRPLQLGRKTASVRRDSSSPPESGGRADLGTPTHGTSRDLGGLWTQTHDLVARVKTWLLQP